jgi:hypothetical protein
VTPARHNPSPPQQSEYQQSFDTPVRRSSNAHVTEITLNQGPSPITSQSHSLLSPANILSIYDEERGREQATTTIPSTSTLFDTMGTVYSSTEDDYREDTESTSSVATDSTNLGPANIDQASDSGVQCNVVLSPPY